MLSGSDSQHFEPEALLRITVSAEFEGAFAIFGPHGKSFVNFVTRHQVNPPTKCWSNAGAGAGDPYEAGDGAWAGLTTLPSNTCREWAHLLREL